MITLTGTGAPAPEDDEFSEWSKFTPCSRSCDKGFYARRRECEIVNGLIVDCVGEKIEVKECNLGDCPGNIYATYNICCQQYMLSTWFSYNYI